MSPSAVPHADRQESQNVMATAVMVPRAKCSRRLAPSVAKVPKFRSSLAVIDLFTAAIATGKCKLPDKCG